MKTLIHNNLWERLIKQSDIALQNGSLISLPTDYQIHNDQGVEFIIRILHNLKRKQAATHNVTKDTTKKVFNPFLPYEEDMYVGHLNDTHLCLLNKFNVVEHHLLIVTSDYQSQDKLLNEKDCNALALCLAQIDGLGFYNGGKTAGASQHHKHLQVVPLPLVKDWHSPHDNLLPIESLLNNTPIKPLPFHAQVHHFNDSTEPRDGTQLYCVYKNLMDKANRWPANNLLQPSGAYNMLCTQQWMMIVPRTQECLNTISINSMGFAGSLLVKSQDELTQLLKIGPMQILKHTSAQ